MRTALVESFTTFFPRKHNIILMGGLQRPLSPSTHYDGKAKYVLLDHAENSSLYKLVVNNRQTSVVLTMNDPRSPSFEQAPSHTPLLSHDSSSATLPPASPFVQASPAPQ